MQRQPSPVNYNQVRIIDQLNLFLSRSVFKSLGIVFDEDGICSGLAGLYLIYKALSKEDTFFSKLAEISTLDPFIASEKIDSELMEFLQNIYYAIDPSKFQKEGRQINFGDLHKLNLAGNNIESRYTLGLHWDKTKLDALLADIAQEEEMVYMVANGHVIGLYRKHNKYYLYDPNHHKGEIAFKNINDMSAEVLRCLFVKAQDTHIDLRIKTFRLKFNLNHEVKYPDKVRLINEIQRESDPAYNRSLFSACCIGDEEMVAELLKRNANPFISIDGASAFCAASLRGYDRIVARILDRFPVAADSKVYLGLLAALTNPVSSSAEVILKHIMERRPSILKNNCQRILQEACTCGNASVARTVLQWAQTNNVNIDQKVLFIKAAESGHRALIHLLLNSCPALSADHGLLEIAVKSSIDNNHVAVFVELSRYINFGPIHVNNAIASQRPQMLAVMLNSKLKIHFQQIELAARQIDFAMIRQLLQAQKNHFNGDSNKLRALAAAIEGDVASCKALLREVTNPEFAQDLFASALCANQTKLCSALSACGVKLNSEKENVTARFISACKNNDIEAVAILLHHGVDKQQMIRQSSDDGKAETVSVVARALARHQDTLLMVLLRHRNIKLTEELVVRLLNYACSHGRLDILFELQRRDVVIKNFDLLPVAEKARQYAMVEYLLRQDFNPGNKTFLTALCRNGRLDRLKSLVSSCQNVFSTIEITDLILNAIERNSDKEIECLFLLMNESIKAALPGLLSFAYDKSAYKAARVLFAKGANVDQLEKDRYLAKACQSGQADFVNELLLQGAKFNGDSTRQLYAAYEVNMGKLGGRDIELMKLAHFHQHSGIYSHLLHKGKYMLELREHVAQSQRASMQIRLFDRNLDPVATFYKACEIGMVKLIKTLLQKKAINLQEELLKGIETAAISRQHHVVVYFVANLKTSEIQQFLLLAAKNHHYLAMTAILEVIKPQDLTQELMKALHPHQAIIKQLYEDVLLRDKSGQPLSDHAKRVQDTTNNKNALHVIFDLPAPRPSQRP